MMSPEKQLTETTEDKEKAIEWMRLWQLLLGPIVGFMVAMTPNFVTYVDKNWLNPPAIVMKCEGNISITYPKNKEIVYGDEVDVAGAINPNKGCKYVFLTVATMDGHQFFTTDAVTVNPDGTWDATAKLYFVPQGTRARIQARLCGNHDAYPPEACLPEVPSKGIASNSVIIRRQAGLPAARPTTRAMAKPVDGWVSLKILEFTPVFASGQVKGLVKPEDYKIVIYDKDHKYGWVKQPYPGNLKGYSWAAVLPNGEWSITLRERPANKMGFMDERAILLMKRDSKAPDRTKSLDNLDVVRKEIRKNGSTSDTQ